MDGIGGRPGDSEGYGLSAYRLEEVKEFLLHGEVFVFESD